MSDSTHSAKSATDDDAESTTTRRTFLGGLAATTILSSTTGAARATATDTDESRRRPPQGSIDVSSTGLYLDAFDDSGDVTVDAHPEDDVDCASVSVGGEWGEASATLTPTQARKVAAMLMEAADVWEER